MAYHGYFLFVDALLDSLPAPNVLEVGVHRGQTFLPILSSLMRKKEAFNLIGLDIFLRDNFEVSFGLMRSQLSQNQHASICIDDSLSAMSNIRSSNSEPEESSSASEIFDLILLDGDHNYGTVSKELILIKDLIRNQGLVLIDDYDMVKDEFFAEKPEYVEKNIGNKREKLLVEGKEGVQTAVDDFVAQNPDFKLFKLTRFLNESPVLMTRHDLDSINKNNPGLITKL